MLTWLFHIVSWLYKIRPSVGHGLFVHDSSCSKLDFNNGITDPNQRRWLPFKMDMEEREKGTDFIQGLRTLAYSDSEATQTSSIAIYIYLANLSMKRKCFVNSDGDFLIVPQKGTLKIITEFGRLVVEPNEIVVIQQGMKFSVLSDDQDLRGYVLEVRGNHFELPNLGPIGANGLANPRDFEIPTAFVDQDNLNESHEIVLKFHNQIFKASQPNSPFDVAAWFGNYTPYKFDLSKFVSVNSVSVDHPDPSIFTVLTCPSMGKSGTALADFVIFPPRWECAIGTFRPPYYHRNCMTEFMGLIKGQYQAKSAAFSPGGASLHQQMMPHGPDQECYKRASSQDTSVPARVADDTMAFMFETSLTLKLSSWAFSENVDSGYLSCWKHLLKE